MYLSPLQTEQLAIRQFHNITQGHSPIDQPQQTRGEGAGIKATILSAAGGRLIAFGTMLQQSAHPLTRDVTTGPQC